METSDREADIPENQRDPTSQSFWQRLIWAFLTLMATVWNFHIDVLHTLKLLPAFVKQPLLFVGLCIVLTVFFPPFFILYFLAWLSANHFGITEEADYRAKIK